MTAQASIHSRENVYEYMCMTELSLRSQRAEEKRAEERGTTQRAPFTLSLSVSIVLNANCVTAAQPVLHLPALMVLTLPSPASGGRGARITAVMMPGLGLKRQCDQLCVQSQPFFVLSAKESAAWVADPKHVFICAHWRLGGGVIVEVFEPQAQPDTKEQKTLRSSRWQLLFSLLHDWNKTITIHDEIQKKTQCSTITKT